MTTTIERGEIDDLKRLDIRVFLAGLGWQPDPSDRYKKATYTLDGRKVKVFQAGNGFWIARDFDAGVSYSALDLAFEQVGDKRWRQACDLLRGIIGKTSPDKTPTSHTSPDKPAPVARTSPLPDQPSAKIKKTPEEITSEYTLGSSRWRYGDPVPAYLQSRGIARLSHIFDGTFRVSDSGSGNLRFPHRYLNAENRIAMGGVEKRGASTKGAYSSGGSNGVWQTVGWPESGVIVIFENQIDAMSYDILSPHEGGQMLMSIRAGTEHIAVQLLKAYIDMGKIRTVVIATDNDAAGLGYASRILAGLYVSKADREPGQAKYHGGATAYYVTPPDLHEDWNDALRASSANPEEPSQTF